jgi:hypothetical protein
VPKQEATSVSSHPRAVTDVFRIAGENAPDLMAGLIRLPENDGVDGGEETSWAWIVHSLSHIMPSHHSTFPLHETASWHGLNPHLAKASLRIGLSTCQT